jgi:O-antigen/teichoic acid export membrane protein
MLSRLSSNSIWILGSRVGSQLGLAIFTILVARTLGSTGFGEYAFVASVVFIGNVITTFGTDMLLIREIASTKDLSNLSPALFIQLGLTTAFVSLVYVASALVPAPASAAVAALRIYSLSLFAQAFFTVYTTALRGRQHMRAYSVLNATTMSAQLVVALWLYWRHGDLIQLAFLLLAVQLFSALFAGLACKIVLPHELRLWSLDFGRLRPLMKASAPIAVLGALGVLYQRFSLLLLPGLAGATAAGWFSAGARLVEAAKTGHGAALTAIFPMMAETHAVSPEHWSRAFRIPGLILLGGGLVGAVALYLLAAPLVLLLFGTEYLASISVVRILAWILVPYAINSFLTLALLARGQERTILQGLTLSAAVLVALTVWWAPQAGAPGAAAAALCAETVQAVFFVAADLWHSRILTTMLTAGGARE